jgi:hypothetical protein
MAASFSYRLFLGLKRLAYSKVQRKSRACRGFELGQYGDA